ncbi:hypothetical protein GCM10017673_48100 [Streptosporangium violaceochromogenes]|nr:hypothetical protein GCM10017673_48100 [Streptosporangium violaceochromogenes]
MTMPTTPAVRDDPAGRPRPLIRLNDFGAVTPPELGAWTPRRTVSVVVPAFRCDTLPLTLASLAAQSYPAHLMEVVVVDDGNTPALRLPEIVPERTRIIPSRPGGWGRAWACQTGADAAEGEVIHWLDADMVVFREQVEAQMRWHHLADYFTVLGRLKMVAAWDAGLSPAEVHAAVSAGETDKLFAPGSPGSPGSSGDPGRREGAAEPGGNVVDTWSGEYVERTRDLRDAGLDAFKVHVGATASLPAALLRSAGGMDTSLVLAEDTELGYRLAQAGAVFVADGESRSRHLGASTVMRREQEVKRHNWVFLGNRVPVYRWLRRHPARQWEVPYVEVVVTMGDASYEAVRATVDGFLRGSVADIRVTVVGPWPAAPGARRSPLDDPALDLRLVRELYAHEGRVRLAGSAGRTPFPIPFRLVCPPGWVPAPDCLHRLTRLADQEGYGLVSLALAETDGVVAARLERTAAFSRAWLVRGEEGPGGIEDLEDVVDATFGTLWLDGETWGLLPMEKADGAQGAAAGAERWRRKALRWKRRVRRLERRLDRTPMRRLRRVLRGGLSLRRVIGGRGNRARSESRTV